MRLSQKINELTKQHYRILVLKELELFLSSFIRQDGQEEPENFIPVTIPQHIDMLVEKVVPQNVIEDVQFELRQNIRQEEDALEKELNNDVR